MRDYGSLRTINAYTCGRCGRWVCSSCGGQSPGYGYGVQDEAKYGQICKECYYELQTEYRAKWEAEFGAEERSCEIENPYGLSDDEEEWRRRLSEYKAWRDSRQQEG